MLDTLYKKHSAITRTKVSKERKSSKAVQTALLICGITSSLFYIAMNVFIPMQWHAYSYVSQTISELSAIDAPTRPLWVPFGIVYALFTAAFGWGVWKSAVGNRPLRIIGGLLFINGIISLFWPPMHQREILAAGGGTLTDTMHIAFSIVTVLLFLLSIGFGAAALGKRFRLYSIATMLILIAFGILTALDAPRIETNLPTPLIGVWERINIGVYMIWVVVLAFALLRREKMRNTINTNVEKIK
jgi:hypothetical protein